MRKIIPIIPKIGTGPNQNGVKPTTKRKRVIASKIKIGKPKTLPAVSPASFPANSRALKVPFFICFNILNAFPIPIIKIIIANKGTLALRLSKYKGTLMLRLSKYKKIPRFRGICTKLNSYYLIFNQLLIFRTSFLKLFMSSNTNYTSFIHNNNLVGIYHS